MGKVLFFIYNDMADFEFTLAASCISWLKKEVVTISYDQNVIHSKSGLQYSPHLTVKEALSLEDVDGLIIPGGWNNEQKDELTFLIRKLNNEMKLLAAICAGPQYLARAGVLKDKKYTTTLTNEYLNSQRIEDFFPRENFIKENVVKDQNMITALGHCFVDFSMEIMDYFQAFKSLEEKEIVLKHYKGMN